MIYLFNGGSEEQNYSPGAGSDYGPNGGYGNPSPLDGIKKFIPIIIIVIIVAIGAFVALSYLASQQNVSINLKDSDGRIVEGKITLKDSAQKIISVDPKDTSDSFTVKLFPGDYRVSATASGYKSSSKTITVTSEDKDFDINMSRDLQAALNAEFTTTNIFEGQTLSGKLSVSNNGSEFSTSDIISNSTSPLDVTITPSQTSTVTSGGSLYLDFTVAVKAASNLKDIKNAKLSFKIKGSDVVSNSIAVSAMPSVAAKDVTLTGTLTSTALAASTEKSFAITIHNNNRTIPLQNIKIEVIPDPDYNQRISWFRFSNPDPSADYITNIDGIDPTKQAAITLYVKPSLTAKKGDDFKGTLKITSVSLNGEETITMNFVVSTEKTASLQFLINGTDPTTPLIINCSKTTGACTPLSFSSTKDAALKNNGNVDISQIKIEVNLLLSSADCQAYLTNFKTINPAPNIIPTLAAGTSTPIEMDISAPADAADKAYTRCLIQWTYIDPLSDPAQTVTDSKLIEIDKSLK